MNITPSILKGMRSRPTGLPMMQDAWLNCVSWAISKPEFVTRFKADTGIDLEVRLLNRSPIQIEIDGVTGFERDTLISFCDWVTENIWGTD